MCRSRHARRYNLATTNRIKISPLNLRISLLEHPAKGCAMSLDSFHQAYDVIGSDDGLRPLVTDRDPGPGKSQPFFSDYYPGPGNFQEKPGLTGTIFTKVLFVQDCK